MVDLNFPAWRKYAFWKSVKIWNKWAWKVYFHFIVASIIVWVNITLILTGAALIGELFK